MTIVEQILCGLQKFVMIYTIYIQTNRMCVYDSLTIACEETRMEANQGVAFDGIKFLKIDTVLKDIRWEINGLRFKQNS